ncbi:TonB-dependent receptor plug domain-containing protein, partial [bacterium]|nr:TonB-dependent receptor plug domain-containing protein [bacterium]
LEIIPGVSFWRKGPPGSSTGFSVSGRKSYGMNLLVNGMPLSNIYTSEPLVKFIDLSRVKRIEVVYSGSPSINGYISNAGAINVVLERGGRESPFAQANFTYGGNNRRARRIWFSTPKSYINGTIVYNEYLQDFFEPLAAYPKNRVGRDDARSVSMEVSFGCDPQHSAVIHFTRFEDTFAGSACSSLEDIRSRGFDSWMQYRHNGLKASVRNFGFKRERFEGSVSGLRSTLSLIFDRKLGRVHMRNFFSGRRDYYENRFAGKRVAPEIENYEGGIVISSHSRKNFALRSGIYGGEHSEAGSYLGGEFGISHEGKTGSYETLLISRKMVLPSAAMLFHPEPDTIFDCYEIRNIGNKELRPEITHEISLEKYFSSGLLLHLFLRREEGGIIAENNNNELYNSSNIEEVSGIRAEYGVDGKYRGSRFGYKLAGDYFLTGNDYTDGIPEYRVSGNLFLKMPVFKDTETLTLRFDSIETGRRSWGTMVIEPAAVQNFSVSITLMSALIKLQIRNFMDSRYQTLPGYYMGERHFRIGIIWNFVN